MQSLIIPVLTGVASSVEVGTIAAMWHRLKKSVDKAIIIVALKGSNKSIALPRNYSPAAVEELLALTA